MTKIICFWTFCQGICILTNKAWQLKVTLKLDNDKSLGLNYVIFSYSYISIYQFVSIDTKRPKVLTYENILKYNMSVMSKYPPNGSEQISEYIWMPLDWPIKYLENLHCIVDACMEKNITYEEFLALPKIFAGIPYSASGCEENEVKTQIWGNISL